MKQDRFDEFYMMQTQAKALEKQNKRQQALALYQQIIDDYFPDTDYSFQRAVILLDGNHNDERIRQYCHMAIERIAAGDMRGNKSFFENYLAKLDAVAPTAEKPPAPTVKRLKVLAALGYGVLSILLAYPDKYFKLAFMLSIAASAYLLIEIVRRVSKQLSIRWQSIGLLIMTVLTFTAATHIPPPEWTSFFSLQALSQLGSGSAIGQTQQLDNSETQLTAIDDDDLATLAKLQNDQLILSSYQLNVDEKRIDLIAFAQPSASTAAIKKRTYDILKELNAIKGARSYDDNLGDLYQAYSTHIRCFDANDKLILRGEVSRFTLKIKWSQ